MAARDLPIPPPPVIAQAGGDQELAGVQPFGQPLPGARRGPGRAGEGEPQRGVEDRQQSIQQLRDKVRELARVAEEIATILRAVNPSALAFLRPIVEAGRALEQEVIEAEARRGGAGRPPATPPGPTPGPVEGPPPATPV